MVAPGFIDLHTHSDEGITESRTRLNLNYLTQGVTTVVTGNCGSGPVDVARYLAAIDGHGAGTNVIHLIPQGSLRSAVMGVADRPPSQAELDRMKNLVARGMAAGAWGMASGLIYVPSRYASTAELIELAKVVAESGGLYASHIRDEEDGLLEAIDEAIAIGKSAALPVHISHLKANGQANWGKAVLALERIKAARQAGQVVTADQYPYIASSTRLGAMVVPHWAVRVSGDEFARMAASPDRGPLLRAEIQRELDRRGGGGAIRIARFAPQPGRVGRDLVTIARQEGVSPLDVVLDIQRKGGAQAINFGMSESDVRTIMSHGFVATASDGATHLPGGGDRPHPRAYGTFPRKIRYALDEHVLSLEQAVRSCTGLPAEILGLTQRGVIRPGAFADLVVFDPKTFRDAATFDDPTRFASGVSHLYVNGVALIAAGKPLFKPGTKANLPGRALRPRDEGPAELIVSVGRIWTGDGAQPWAEAVACRGGALLAVGSRQEVMRYKGPKTTIIDRTSAFAMPGLIDAHGHIESLGASLEQVDLRGVSSLDEVARRVKARIERLARRSMDHRVQLGPEPLARRRLSHRGRARCRRARPAGVADPGRRPRRLGQFRGHAPRRASTRKQRPPPTARSSATRMVCPRASLSTEPWVWWGRWFRGPRVVTSSGRILAAQKLILAQGLTGVHDAGISQTEADVYRDLDRAGELRLRVYAMASPPGGREVEFVSRPPARASSGARFELQGDQALHRRSDGLARRTAVRALPRRSGEQGAPADRAQGAGGNDHGGAEERLAGGDARDRRSRQRPCARRLCRRTQGRSPGARSPAADRARPGCAASRTCRGSPRWASSPRCSRRTPATTCAGPTPAWARAGSRRLRVALVHG